VYDVGEKAGLSYLSMEYVDGEDLSSLLRRIGRLPVDKALKIAQQICAGLAAAHAKRILHLDLKPSNVMIDGHGFARITDFGLATAAFDAISTELAGTPAYMAPEQLTGQRATTATDNFSLGLVLYEMFGGRQLFPASSISERRSMPSQLDPPPPSTYARDLDVAIDVAVLNCLMTDPAERPPSAVAAAAALFGGDVLKASLAAGHIPSPELVATYDARGTLRPVASWLLFVCTIGGMLLAAVNSGALMLFRQVPFK
jgi:serine/threonine-protein kinase